MAKDTIYYKREKGKLEVRGTAGKVWWIIFLDRLGVLIQQILFIYFITHHVSHILKNVWSWGKNLFS